MTSRLIVKTHVADRRVGDWAWRTGCGRLVSDSRLIVEEQPGCRTCAKWCAKWRMGKPPDGDGSEVEAK